MTTHPQMQHPPAGAGLFYPPGGLVVWFFILIELFTFGAALVIFSFQRAAEPALFADSQRLLNVPLATLNTAVLVTSGFFAARGAAFHERGDARSLARAARAIRAAAGLGTLFVLLKGVEYWEKVAGGHGIAENAFFSFYWGLTGFHLLHVVIGIGILLHFSSRLGKGAAFEEADAGVETGVAFWHMCDLIWVLLFPLIYLAR